MPKVDHLDYEPARISLAIFYTAKQATFSCTYAGRVYQNKDIRALKGEVLEAIKAAYALEWVPVIEIAQPGKLVPDVKLALRIERKYVGFHRDLGYKQCHWTAEPEQRLAVSQSFNWRQDDAFDLPASQEHSTEVLIWLPYTQETWRRLEELTRYLQIAQRALQNTLVDEEGVTRALDASRSLFDHYTTRNNGAEERIQ